MRVTPLDIINKRFHKKFRGLDDNEVYALLGIIREEMEDLLRENFYMKDTIHKFETQVKEYKDLNAILQNLIEQFIKLKSEGKIS